MTWDDMPWRWYEDYERGRPGYPPEVVEIAGLPATATVLEVAAGTGKLTRVLTSSFARVVAVEPDSSMRRMLAAHCPEADSKAGSAEQIPLADDSVDAVFAAQSFHWFDNEPALLEIARVLRAGGALVTMWNVPTGPTEPSIAAIEELLRPGWPDGFGFPLDLSLRGWTPGAWELPFTRATFEAVRQIQMPNPQTVDKEGLIAFFGSMGWIASLPEEDLLALFDGMRSRLTATEYVLPWETQVHWTQLRIPGPG